MLLLVQVVLRLLLQQLLIHLTWKTCLVWGAAAAAAVPPSSDRQQHRLHHHQQQQQQVTMMTHLLHLGVWKAHLLPSLQRSKQRHRHQQQNLCPSPAARLHPASRQQLRRLRWPRQQQRRRQQ